MHCGCATPNPNPAYVGQSWTGIKLAVACTVFCAVVLLFIFLMGLVLVLP